jgi:hypothetical protein
VVTRKVALQRWVGGSGRPGGGGRTAPNCRLQNASKATNRLPAVAAAAILEGTAAVHVECETKG